MNDDFGDDFGYDDAYGGSQRQSIIGKFDENPFRAKSPSSSSKRPIPRHDSDDDFDDRTQQPVINKDVGEKLPPGVRIQEEPAPVQASQQNIPNADDRTRFDGILHRMKAGFMGRVLWTPVWCFIDDYRIVQYKDSEKPRSYRIKPIFQLDLDKCTVEETKVQGKQFCLKVTEKKSSNSCIYACEFEKDLDFLLTLMNKQAIYKAQKEAEQKRQQQEEEFDDFRSTNDYAAKSPMKYQSEDIDEDINDSFDDEVKPTAPPNRAAARASIKPSSVKQLFNTPSSVNGDDRMGGDTSVRRRSRAASKREIVKTPQPKPAQIVEEPYHHSTNSDGIDEDDNQAVADELRDYSGCMYRLKSGLFGRSIWNVKWVDIDEKRMLQYDSNSKPSNYSAKPIHTFNLDYCVIEPYEHEYVGKRYAFKIVDKQEALSCVYAFIDPEHVPYVMPLLLKRSINLAAQVDRKSYQQVPMAQDDEDDEEDMDESPNSPKQATPFKSNNMSIDEDEVFDIDDEIKHYSDDEDYIPPPQTPPKPSTISSASATAASTKLPPATPLPAAAGRAGASAKKPMQSQPILAMDASASSRADADNFSDLSDFMPMQEDIIIDHFEKNNISPEVRSTTWYELVHLLISIAGGKCWRCGHCLQSSATIAQESKCLGQEIHQSTRQPRNIQRCGHSCRHQYYL
jgi:hypothetical protein